MSKDDFQKEIKKISTRAKYARKQELAQEKEKRREEYRTDKMKSEARSKEKEKEITPYTAVIVAKLEYEGVIVPGKEQLAEDLGAIVVKWFDQKNFYALNPKEPVPKLISIDVYMK